MQPERQEYFPLTLHPQPFNFEPEGIVLGDLPGQKMSRKLSLGSNSLGSKEVDIATLAGVVAEVLNLDESLGQQRFQQIVRFAEAHPKLLRHLALRAAGTGIEKTKHAENRGIGHQYRRERKGFVHRLNIGGCIGTVKRRENE